MRAKEGVAAGSCRRGDPDSRDGLTAGKGSARRAPGSRGPAAGGSGGDASWTGSLGLYHESQGVAAYFLIAVRWGPLRIFKQRNGMITIVV